MLTPASVCVTLRQMARILRCTVDLPSTIVDRIDPMARRERRSRSSQLRVLIEMGLTMALVKVAEAVTPGVPK